jgi:hypothetical protein
VTFVHDFNNCFGLDGLAGQAIQQRVRKKQPIAAPGLQIDCSKRSFGIFLGRLEQSPAGVAGRR